MWLGLFVSVFSVPGVTSATVPAGWAAISLASPWIMHRSSPRNRMHWFMATFFLYACASSLWAPDWHNSIWRLWEISCILLAMWLGASLRSLQGIAIGLALGCTVSSLLSIAQAFGWQPVLWYTIHGQAGLFYNPVFQGMTLALVILLLVEQRLWLLIPGLLPGLYLSHSRGAWFALAVGLLVGWFRSAWITTLAYLSILLYVTFALSTAEHERLQIIVGAIPNLTFFGLGAGSFTDLWIGPLRPEYGHNDAFQLVFEFGVGALPILLVLGWVVWRGNPVLAAFIVLGAFTFPLYTPLPAIIFGIVAGHLSVRPMDIRTIIHDRRYDRLSRFPGWRSNRRPEVVSLQPQT